MPSAIPAPKLEHNELDAEIAWIARQVNTASDEELPANECSELVQQLMMLKQQQVPGRVGAAAGVTGVGRRQ
jgi:hypothetical protein